jgi:hypothetical protein
VELAAIADRKTALEDLAGSLDRQATARRSELVELESRIADARRQLSELQSKLADRSAAGVPAAEPQP